jgi:hypothetical protein
VHSLLDSLNPCLLHGAGCRKRQAKALPCRTNLCPPSFSDCKTAPNQGHAWRAAESSGGCGGRGDLTCTASQHQTLACPATAAARHRSTSQLVALAAPARPRAETTMQSPRGSLRTAGTWTAEPTPPDLHVRNHQRKRQTSRRALCQDDTARSQQPSRACALWDTCTCVCPTVCMCCVMAGCTQTQALQPVTPQRQGSAPATAWPSSDRVTTAGVSHSLSGTDVRIEPGSLRPSAAKQRIRRRGVPAVRTPMRHHTRCGHFLPTAGAIEPQAVAFFVAYTCRSNQRCVSDRMRASQCFAEQKCRANAK